jgi:hypothetical protein
MHKSEMFAVSLRKTKKRELLELKRLRMHQSEKHPQEYLASIRKSGGADRSLIYQKVSSHRQTLVRTSMQDELFLGESNQEVQ